MSCDDLGHAIDAYALGALDLDAADALDAHLDAHLAVCPDCRRRLATAERAAHALPLALARASGQVPPAALKDRLLAAVTDSDSTTHPFGHQPAPETQAPRSPRASGAPALAPAARPGATPWAGGKRAIGDARRWRWAAVAAMLIVIVSVAWSVRLSSALDRERATRERVEAFYSREQELVLEVVDSASATRLVLRSPVADSDAYGKLFTRPDLPDIVVMAARLPTPSDGHAYHLWLTSGGVPVDAGVLPVDEQGFGLLTLRADRPGPAYDAVEVRLQPGGATAPNGTVVLRWDAAAPGD